MSMITTSDEVAPHCTDLLAALHGRPPARRDSRAPEWVAVPTLFVRDGRLWPGEHPTSAASNKPSEAGMLGNRGRAADIDQPNGVNAAIPEFLR
jgi:hypothetical protein